MSSLRVVIAIGLDEIKKKYADGDLRLKFNAKRDSQMRGMLQENNEGKEET